MRRGLLISALFPCALLLGSTLDCGGSLYGPPYVYPQAPGSPQTATTVGAGTRPTTSGPAAPDPLADVKQRGEVHAETMIPASGGRPQRWIVFLGTKDVARAAWIVTPNATVNGAVPVADWAEGVKVIGVATRMGHLLYVLIETAQTLDQPAGVKSVWRIDADDSSTGSLDDDWRFVGVQSLEELNARLDAPAQGGPLRADDMAAALKAASTSLPSLAKAFNEKGADYYVVWQGAIPQSVEHIADYKGLAASKRARHMLAMVTAAGTQERCESNICWAQDVNGNAMGGVALAIDGGSIVIQGFVESAWPPPAGVGGAPKAVTNAPNPNATMQALREQIIEMPTRMLGEAPLGDGDGTIGVGEVGKRTDPNYRLFVVVREGNFARVYDEKSSIRGGLAPQDVRFADITGDGRSDVVIRSAGKWESDQSNVTYMHSLMAPNSVQIAELEADFAADLAMSGAATIDDAVKAALLVPTHGVKIDDACRVLAGVHTVEGFKKVATPDAKVIAFDSLGAPLLHAMIKGVGNLRPDDVNMAGRRCRQLDCDPARPVCTLGVPGGASEIYWFNFGPDGRALVSGVGFYEGQ